MECSWLIFISEHILDKLKISCRYKTFTGKSGITRIEFPFDFGPAIDIVLEQNQVFTRCDGDAALTTGSVIIINSNHSNLLRFILLDSILDEVILVHSNVSLVTVLNAVTVTVAGGPIAR